MFLADDLVDEALHQGPGDAFGNGRHQAHPVAQAVLDRLLTDFTVETVLRDVVRAYLNELGHRWARGAVSVAQEHFASSVLRGLAGLARGWGNGRGPQALLACPPDELHDLA